MRKSVDMTEDLVAALDNLAGPSRHRPPSKVVTLQRAIALVKYFDNPRQAEVLDEIREAKVKTVGADISLDGLFWTIRNGIDAIGITSTKMHRSIGILGSRPPFRDPSEVTKLDPQDIDLATKLAIRASGIVAATREIHRFVPGVDSIVVSRSGALAVCVAQNTELMQEELAAIQGLDNNNYQIVL